MRATKNPEAPGEISAATLSCIVSFRACADGRRLDSFDERQRRRSLIAVDGRRRKITSL